MPAPLPLLGTFHEVSLAVGEVRAAVDFYERLGFSQASTADTFAHHYGVLTDGRLFVGLHGRGGASPVLTFVRPGIAQYLPAFAAAGLELDVCRTGDEVFNEVAFTDPAGQALAVLEARTYSPVVRSAHEVSLCGDFAEVSLPAADFAAMQGFWEALGFVAADEVAEPYPHLPLTSDYLNVSFHPPRVCDRAMLVFRDAGLEARIARLRELGVQLAALGRGTARTASALIESPGDTALLLLQSS